MYTSETQVCAPPPTLNSVVGAEDPVRFLVIIFAGRRAAPLGGIVSSHLHDVQDLISASWISHWKFPAP